MGHERFQPAAGHEAVGIEEGDELGGDSFESGVAGGGRTPRRFVPDHPGPVTQGHGWYGFHQDLDATATMLRALDDVATRFERPNSLGRLQISVTPPGPVDRDTARRFEDLGVDRLIVMRGLADMANADNEDAVIGFVEHTARELSLG